MNLPLGGAAALAALLLAVGSSVPAVARPVRIALISDTHTTRGTAGDEPTFKPHLAKVIAAVNEAKVDVVLVAGDLTQGGLAQQFADFTEQAQGFRAPIRWVPGNHDVGDKHTPGKEGGITEKRLLAYEKAMGASYYTANVPGLRIVALNASLFGSSLPEDEKQWAFLEAEMARKSKSPTIVLMHYPLFVKTRDEPGGEYFNLEPDVRQRLIGLFEKGGVRAVLTGHLHHQMTHEIGSMVLVTTPPVSWGIPKESQREGWTLVTVPATGPVTYEWKYIER